MVDVRKASSASREGVERQGRLVDRDVGASAQLEHERAGHPEQATRRTRAASPASVAHDEHVGAGGLAQLVARVGEDGLARAALVRVGERAHVLGVRRGLQPRGGAAVVAHPRHDDDASPIGPRAQRAARGDDDRRPRARRAPSRAVHAAGDRDAQARLVVAVGLAAPRAPAASRSVRSGTGRPRPDAECAEPVEVAGPRERLGRRRPGCVSNTPSPTSSPWSKGEMRASSTASERPLTHTAAEGSRRPARRPRHRSRRRRPRGGATP